MQREQFSPFFFSNLLKWFDFFAFLAPTAFLLTVDKRTVACFPSLLQILMSVYTNHSALVLISVLTNEKKRKETNTGKIKL